MADRLEVSLSWILKNGTIPVPLTRSLSSKFICIEQLLIIFLFALHYAFIYLIL